MTAMELRQRLVKLEGMVEMLIREAGLRREIEVCERRAYRRGYKAGYEVDRRRRKRASRDA